VTYACEGGELKRYSGYTAANADQPTSGFTGGAVLVKGVTSCKFSYSSSASQGAGLVTLDLRLAAQTSGGGSESVGLYHAVHVNNVP
jgi:MSHA biogenesis protein MshO